MLANIRFEISISYVLQKSQLFCVYRELKQSGETSGARLKMESEAMGAWSLRPLRVILTPEVSTCAWKLILEKKTTGLATVWQSKACVQPYGRGTRLIRCHSNFSMPGPTLVSPVIKSLVWVTPIGNSQNTDTVSDYWTGEGRVIQEAKCIFLLYSTGLRFYFT